MLGLLLGGVATARGCFGEPHLLAGPPVFRPQWLPSNREPLWLTFLLAPFLKSTGLSDLQTLSLPSSSDLPHPPQPLQGQAVVKPKTFSFSQMLRFWVSVVENGTIEEGQIQYRTGSAFLPLAASQFPPTIPETPPFMLASFPRPGQFPFPQHPSTSGPFRLLRVFSLLSGLCPFASPSCHTHALLKLFPPLRALWHLRPFPLPHLSIP